jgi:hypothetical protein
VGIWDQLNTKTIGDFPSNEIQKQSNPVHLQDQNRSNLEDIVLINRATMRNGSPMPDQGKIVQTTGDSDRIQFQPEEGQVWLFVGGDWLSQSGGTSAINVEMRDANGNVTFLFNESTNGQVALSPALYGADIYVTNTLYLYANITSGEGRLSTAFVRVR